MAILNRPPHNAGPGFFAHREQVIGEITGLQRLSVLLKERKQTLEDYLNNDSVKPDQSVQQSNNGPKGLEE